MAEITAAAVGKLRETSGAGLMDCKKALTETQGDFDAALDWLRKKGAATAVKKGGRDAREGVIHAYIAPGAKLGLILEVNCETDFVARNESFLAFCADVAKKLAANPSADLEADRVAAVTKIGENIKVGRHQRVAVAGNGLVAAYIHTGAKVGVLVEVGAGKEATTTNDDFKQIVRDITLQIAAAHPTAVAREEVPAELVAKEREIASTSDAVKNKPPQAMVKIVEGKLEKFYQGICLLEQGFVKNPDLTVKAHVAATAKTLGDEITIRRFIRLQVGESAAA